MPKFHYKATRGEGEIYEETLELPDRFAVYAEVRKGGGTVISIDEVRSGLHLDTKRLSSLLGGVRTSEKIIFARNLGAMLAAGLSLSRGLAVFERQTENRYLKEVLRSLIESIKRGKSLHESMEQFPKVFPKLFVAMVKAGEESGNLSGALLGVAMLMFVVPTLTTTFKEFNVELPLSTRIIIGVSDWFAGNLPLALLVLIGGAVGIVALLRTSRGH